MVHEGMKQISSLQTQQMSCLHRRSGSSTQQQGWDTITSEARVEMQGVRVGGDRGGGKVGASTRAGWQVRAKLARLARAQLARGKYAWAWMSFPTHLMID